MLFLVHQAALGQGSYTAQVRGTVTDPAHAVVNNAKVTVTNESTSIATTATTNASGEYVVNGLRPASYTIKVEAPGFRDVVRTGLVLAVSQQATVDFALSLASTSGNGHRDRDCAAAGYGKLLAGHRRYERVRKPDAIAGPRRHATGVSVGWGYEAEQCGCLSIRNRLFLQRAALWLGGNPAGWQSGDRSGTGGGGNQQ